MTKKRGNRFAVKWKGKIYKAIRITRSRDCIVFASPGLPFHTTYPKNGNLHWTFEEGSPPLIDNNTGNTTTEKRIYLGKRAEIPNLAGTMSLGTIAGFMGECKDSPKNYELIDLDALGYTVPNTFLYLIPPREDELNILKNMHTGEFRIIKFEDAWTVVIFADVGRKT